MAVNILGKMRIFRKGAPMLQRGTDFITCSLCNVSYESDTKLREHQRMSHRGAGTEERPQEAATIVPSQVPHD